ncbi:MAG: alcohol dehydrogenase, partial [Mycobacterium sp.]|nr:alcohol dehydrogenase [Mycobacterium sp.]
WGATIPGTGSGDVVVVLGPGIRGLCVAAAAKDAGAEFLMMTGLGARDAERLALASRFGADLVVDVAVDDPVAALRDATGRLADVVVDVTAKAPAAFAQAIELARPAGTVVVAGTRGWRTGAPGFIPDMVVMKELRIVGALGVDATAYRAALDVLASGRYPFSDLPRRCVGLDEAEDLLATMAGERDNMQPVHGVVTP